jgi:hypothetical protein
MASTPSMKTCIGTCPFQLCGFVYSLSLVSELTKFGHLLELHVRVHVLPVIPAHEQLQVCDNVGDHLIGNVYARYEWETEAQAAVDNLNERWYAGECRSIRTENKRILI